MTRLLTVAFGSILQTESNCQHGVILKELCSKGIPPQVITLLQGVEEKSNPLETQLLDCFSVCDCTCLRTSVQFCSRLLSSNIL